MNSARSLYWARRDLGFAAASILGPNLAMAGALCAAYWLGWFGRSCEATPGSFTRDQYWTPGCGRQTNAGHPAASASEPISPGHNPGHNPDPGRLP